MTSSPSPMPSVSSAMCRPAVPELTATACGTEWYSAKRGFERGEFRTEAEMRRAQDRGDGGYFGFGDVGRGEWDVRNHVRGFPVSGSAVFRTGRQVRER